MSVIDALLKAPVTESSGARTSSRFDYQRHWALSEILSRHTAGKNYLFLFEFHDDILIVDSTATPESIEFCQVKTKRGNPWKLSDLLRRASRSGGEKKLSVLGKLYFHYLEFKTFSISLSFISNADFAFIANKDQPIHKASGLKAKVGSAIQTSVGKELPKLAPIDLNVLFFVRSSLSLDDFGPHIKGQLVDFLNKFIGHSDVIGVDSWYKTLMSEISIKTNNAPSAADTPEKLIKLKAFSREQMASYIADIKAAVVTKNSWSVIEAALVKEGFMVPNILKIQQNWNEVRANKLDVSNLNFASLHKDIQTSMDKIDLSNLSLSTLISTVNEKIKPKHAVGFGGSYSHHYLEAAILWVYCEKTA